MDETPHIADWEAEMARRAAARLPPDCILSRAASAVLAGESPPPGTAAAALYTLHPAGSSAAQAEVTAAAWLLGFARLDARQHADALNVLRGLLLDRHRSAAWAASVCIVASWLCLGSAAVAAVVAVVAGLTYQMADPAPAMLLALGVGYAVGALVRAFGALSPEAHAAALSAAGRLRDVEAVGLAARAVVEQHGRPARDAARAALLAILPAVGARTCSCLAGPLDGHLAGCLACVGTVGKDPGFDEELALALLDALRLTGGTAAVWTVWQARLRGGSQIVRERAGGVLAALIERQRQSERARSLLRPALSPALEPEALLRPARGAGQVTPCSLPRPAYPPTARREGRRDEMRRSARSVGSDRSG